jgi:hypothetical protein
VLHATVAASYVARAGKERGHAIRFDYGGVNAGWASCVEQETEGEMRPQGWGRKENRGPVRSDGAGGPGGYARAGIASVGDKKMLCYGRNALQIAIFMVVPPFGHHATLWVGPA